MGSSSSPFGPFDALLVVGGPANDEKAPEPSSSPQKAGGARPPHLLVRPGDSAARRSPRSASRLEKRLPSMIIFCYAEISEVGQPRPVAGLATPPLAGMTGPSPIRWRAFVRSGPADPGRAGPGQPPGLFRMFISRSTT